jgi:hypothetical protein
MCALYPSIDELGGLDKTEVDEFLKAFRRDAPLLMRAGVVAGSVVFVLSPPITIGVPAPAFVLPRRVLDRHAEKATTHRSYYLRQSVFLVKLAAGLCWGSHADVRKKFGLEPYPADPGSFRS